MVLKAAWNQRYSKHRVMNLKEYIFKRNELVENFAKKSKIWQSDIMIAKFNIVSACLSNYLPKVALQAHRKIFKDIFLHQQLSLFDQHFNELPDYVVYENLNAEIWEILKKGPSIICTFHTGSYRLLNLFLAKHNIAYSLVTSNSVMTQHGISFKKMYNEVSSDILIEEGLKIIDCENANSGLEIIKDIKKGRKILIYIDGNSGSGRETINNSNKCEINFLNQKIFARLGIGYLAHRMQIPILTIVSYRNSINEIRLKFFDPIFSDEKQEKTLSAKKVTQDIYDFVAPIIQQYPEQWEAWLYLHKVADTRGTNLNLVPDHLMSPIENKKLHFNASCFGIFKIATSYFLFTKATYKSYQIEESVYNLLKRCSEQPVLRKEILLVEFAELYKRNVIVPL